MVAIGDMRQIGALGEASSQLGLQVGRRLDVTDRRSFTDFLDTVEERLGTVDVLVNNAGVIAVGSAVDEADAVTQRLLDVNIYGVILGTKLAAQRMLPRGHGHIINIASLGGVLPTEGIATYCATKHAVLGYTDTCSHGEPRQRCPLLGDSADADQYRDDYRHRARRSWLQERRGRTMSPRQSPGMIAKPKPRVFVPRSIGALAAAGQRLMSQRASEALGRALGTGRVFTNDVEVDKRKSYVRRTGTS